MTMSADNIFNIFDFQVTLTKEVPTMFLPLGIVMGFSALKDGLEDYRRHKADNEVNNRPARKVYGSDYVSVAWADVKVGDVLEIRNGELFPADLLCLQTSDSEGTCFVETSNLDGETNLKEKRSPIRGLDPHNRLNFVGLVIEAEKPSKMIAHFDGTLTTVAAAAADSEGDVAPINIQNLMLRGCKLENTEWIRGAVVYTGNDSKVMMNMKHPPSKKSKTERLSNPLIILTLPIQCIVAIGLAVGGFGWFKSGNAKGWYLNPDNSEMSSSEAVAEFFSAILMLSVMFPIAVYVSGTFCKLVQAVFMQFDVEMYDVASDTPAVARTSNLNDDLGQVTHIFSDKTGTLTKNVMKFKACSVGGEEFGSAASTDPIISVLPEASELATLHYDFRDQRFFKACAEYAARGDYIFQEFLTALALCHELVIRGADNSHISLGPSNINPNNPNNKGVLASGIKNIKYKGSSPDEVALVQAAVNLGVAPVSRTPDRMTLQITGSAAAQGPFAFVGYSQYSLSILQVLPFTSDRKRMSIIVKDLQGRIMLYSKGADTVMVERSVWGVDPVKDSSTMASIEKFADQGLRTLVICNREIEAGYYNEWCQQYTAASLLFEDREAALDACADAIERNLNVLGVTGIEDQLQDGVAEAIEQLRNAKIRVWMLTGDKHQTAINIAHSCGLLHRGEHVNEISGVTHNPSVIASQIEVALQQYQKNKDIPEYSLAVSIDGAALTVIQHAYDNFSRSERDRVPTPPIIKPTIQGDVSAQVQFGHEVEMMPVPQQQQQQQQQVLSSMQSPESVFSSSSNGSSTFLTEAHHTKLVSLFAELVKVAQTVVCCRMSPLQKAVVVQTVRSELKDCTTLAIGDGANDVSMIQTAHVGIGINGVEGRQAVLASDYAISQFRFLVRLLLVHGHWAYRRNTKLLSYMFYKSWCYIFVLVWYSAYSASSMMQIYEQWSYQCYSTCFTSLPIIVFACMEQDLSPRAALGFPITYRSGQLQLGLNTRSFIMACFSGIFHSIGLFFIVLYGYSSIGYASGSPVDMWEIGIAMYTAVVVIVNVRIALVMLYWTGLHVFVVVGSMIFWYGFMLALCDIDALATYVLHTMQHMMASANFYLVVLLTIGVCLFFDYSWLGWRRCYLPNPVHQVRYHDLTGNNPKAPPT